MAAMYILWDGVLGVWAYKSHDSAVLREGWFANCFLLRGSL